MKRFAGIFGLAVLLAMPTFAADLPTATAPAAKGLAVDSDVVQIAILLDTSNSMEGLLAQTKAQLWQVVNSIAKAQVEGQGQDIQVALYQYGSPSLGRENGYIRQCVPLTDDLDKVSAALFSLSTVGGDEYCGWAIKDAVEQLKWTTEKGAYKAIFIAGNEPIYQGPVDYQAACLEAVEKGIIVHTIFCGDEKEGIREQWPEGAKAGGGTYAFINQSASLARANTPQDKELADLSAKLNGTYVPYGTNGRVGAANQQAQDRNANGLGGLSIEAERAITKSTNAYQNGGWDLVDAIKSGSVKLQDVKPEDLPQEMRGLDQKGREDYLAAKQKERESIQTQIKQLSDEREKYIAALPPPSATSARGGAAGGASGRGGGGGGAGGAGGGGGSGFGGAVGRAMGGR